MTAAVPRVVRPASASRPQGMMASSVVTQRGKVQSRDVEAMGVGWRERWRNLRAGNADVEALLAFLRRHARRGTFLWAAHPDAPGMGRAPGGLGEENLIRDAAMDTDTDGDGVVDGFQKRLTTGTVTYSLDATAGAQRIALGGTEGQIDQHVLRVFPGDEVTLSVDARLDNTPTDIEGIIFLEFLDSDGGRTALWPGPDFTDTSFARRTLTATAPDDTTQVSCIFSVRETTDGGTGDGLFRDARLLRASSDPATWANPHVNGGSQTGDTLDTAGWPASTANVLRAGDVLRIGGSGETKSAAETDEIIRCFEVAADADSDASGNATIELDPPILSGNTPADGAALRLTGNRARVLIPSYTMPDASPGDILAQVEARYREAV